DAPRTRAVVRHLRVLVQAAADAVPHELAHRREPGRLHRVLNRCRDVTHVRTRADRVDPGGERRRGDPHETLGLGRHPADGYRDRRVTEVPFVTDAEIEADDVALTEHPPWRRD